MIAQLMQLFGHMDAETKKLLSDLFNEAMASPDIGTVLRKRIAKMFVEDPWPSELLGVKRGATRAEIESAYKRTINKLHSDKTGDDRFMKLAERAKQKLLGAS